MNNMTKGNARDCRGSALVELALVAPIFVLLLTGAAEFGRLAYAAIEVTNAARAGVAYAAQSHITASNTAGIRQAARNDGSDVTSLSATSRFFCACSNGNSSTCLPTDCSGARIIEYVQVNTSATVDPLFYYPGLPKTFTLRGRAIMRVAQ
jgi:Flp pilus assembly protein TadG